MSKGINFCEVEDNFFGKLAVFERSYNFTFDLHGVVLFFFGGGINISWHLLAHLILFGLGLTKLLHDIFLVVGVESLFVFGLSVDACTLLGMSGCSGGVGSFSIKQFIYFGARRTLIRISLNQLEFNPDFLRTL